MLRGVIRFVVFILLLCFLHRAVLAQESFVYTNNHSGVFASGINTVSAFTVGEDGVFREIPNSPFETAGRALHSSTPNGDIIVVGNHLYVGNGGAVNAVGTVISPSVSGFSINPSTGNLTPVPGSPFSLGGVTLIEMTFGATADGRFFYLANLRDRTISAFSIGGEGSLVAIPGASYSVGTQISNMRVSQDGRFLAASVHPGVNMYRIGSDGGLTLVSGSPFFHSPSYGFSSLDINCDGTRMFGVKPDGLGTIEVYSISPTGTLAYLASAPSVQRFGANTTYGLVSPNGQYLFVSDFSVNRCIASFAVASTGSLSIVPGSPFSIGTSGVTIESVPGGLATNNTGTILYSSLRRNIIGAYAISTSGALSPLPGSALAARNVDILTEIYALAAYPARTCQTGPSFDICVQDDSNGNLLKLNSIAGDYQFNNCSGFTLGGTGGVIKKGSIVTLQHYIGDRRVLARVDTSINRGTASIQVFSSGGTFTVTDRNTNDNTCACTVH